MAANGSKSAFSEEDITYLIAWANRIREHCTICETVPRYAENSDFTDTKGGQYRINAKDILRHEALNTRSDARTFCDTHGLEDGANLLEEHLQHCRDYECAKGKKLTEDFRKYVFSLEKKGEDPNHNEVG